MSATLHRPFRVLVADDSPSIRELLILLLNMESAFTVVGEARDGVVAVELTQRLQPDLVILDVSMPRLDGIKAIPRVREACPDSRVVIFTGDSVYDVEREAREAGAAAVIAKDMGATTLVDELRALFPSWMTDGLTDDLPAAG